MKTLFILIICFFISDAFSNEKNIKVGMSTALSGPAKGLGTHVKLGVEAYFNQINSLGGIKGRRIQLISLDDGYEPERAGKNMRQLIKKEKVLAVLGNVGTPTAVVTVPIANQKKTLLLGSVTGAGLLRKTPPDRYIINYRASYAEETSEMIKGLLLSGIKASEIALFTQKDGYGDAGYSGAIRALKASGYKKTKNVAHGRYKRNTINIENGLLSILDAKTKPKAIIMVGAYKPCAAFIKLAKKELPKVIFLNVSFVGSIPLLKELGKDAENVIVTQVVPHFNNTELPAIKAYQDSLKQWSPKSSRSFLSLEGYLMAKLFVQALKKITQPLTNERVIDQLERLGKFDLGIGKTLFLSRLKHQASHNVWPTKIINGQYVAFQWKKGILLK
jgi:ABC-type branched-subunit amino acid transport system substrate-binding protein